MPRSECLASQVSAYASGVNVAAYTLPTGTAASKDMILWDSGPTYNGQIIFAFSPG